MLNTITSNFGSYGAFGAILAFVVLAVTFYRELRTEQRERHSDQLVLREEQRAIREEQRAARKELQEAREEQRKDREEQQGRYRLAMEQRRLGEANVVVRSLLNTLTQQGANPFLIFRLPLQNEGDGPVDVLASLVSARVLSSAHLQGIGLHGRDVEWTDYQTFYWTENNENAPFAGISTTKNMLARPTHFIRLTPHERGSLRRIDGVNNSQVFHAAPIHLMYRVFLVIRGYPLGEIMQQLGGESPDYAKSAEIGQLQFESIAQPQYTPWRQVQEALLNLNRMAFRVALGALGSDEEHVSWMSDPLGQLTEQDAWRFFLLYHKDFADGEVAEMLTTAKKRLTDIYGENMVLGAGFRSAPNFEKLQSDCLSDLRLMVDKWIQLTSLIKESRNYNAAEGYTDIKDALQVPPEVKLEGYPVRIHQDPVCHQRWLDLYNEGYFLSKPRLKGPEDTIIREVPIDPRKNEPFVMRIHYFLKTPRDDRRLSDSGRDLRPT